MLNSWSAFDRSPVESFVPTSWMSVGALETSGAVERHVDVGLRRIEQVPGLAQWIVLTLRISSSM